jgi:glycosyltransferase involved in cell wall biosynthesis
MLAIDARVLTPNRDGGSLRMSNLLRIFRERGIEIAFVPTFPQSFPPFSDSLAEDRARLQAIGVDLPDATSVEAHLEAAGARYDMVLITGAYVASRHLDAVRRFAPHATLLFDTIDLHYLREYRAAKLTGNVARLQLALKLKQLELGVARAADVTLVVSAYEQELLHREDPRIRTCIVPLVHDLRPTPAPLSGRRDLMFLGAFTFDANVDAMRHFSSDVLPAVRRRLPHARLCIVGSDPTPEILALRSAGVVVSGYVDDLSVCFDQSRVFVAPLRFGAGIKSKLLMSMAQGVPAVASPIAVEGIPAEDGCDVIVARGPDDWAEAIVRLHEDDALWARIAAGGRSLVDNHYSFGAVSRQVDGLLDLIGYRAPTSASVSAW